MTLLDPRLPDLRTALKASLEKWNGPSPRAAQARYRTAATRGFAPRGRLAAAAVAVAMVGAMGGVATAYEGVTLPFTSVHIGGNGGGAAGGSQPSISQPTASTTSRPTCATNSALCLSTPDPGRHPAKGPASTPPQAEKSPPSGGAAAADSNPSGTKSPCQPGWGQADGSGKDHAKATPPPRCP